MCTQDFLVVVVVVAQAGPDMDLVDMDLVDMGLELVMGQEEAMLQDQGLDMEQVLESDKLNLLLYSGCFFTYCTYSLP